MFLELSFATRGQDKHTELVRGTDLFIAVRRALIAAGQTGYTRLLFCKAETSIDRGGLL